MKRVSGVWAMVLLGWLLPSTAAASWEEVCRERCCREAAVDGLVINEIHYNPSYALQGPDYDWEFVELWNVSAEPVDLADYVLDAGGETQFEPGTVVPAGGFAVVADAPQSYPQLDCPVIELAGNLSNAGETLSLRLAATGALVDQVSYDDRLPWPRAADDDGPSLELVDPAGDNALPAAWAVSSSLIGGTPGAMNSVYASPAIDLCTEEDVAECVADCMSATLVALHSFQAFGGISAIGVVWVTAWEMDTAGFNLYRDGKRINARLIPAQNAPGGAVYRYCDTGATPYRRHTYTLEEVTHTGDRLTYAETAVAQSGLLARVLAVFRHARQ